MKNKLGKPEESKFYLFKTLDLCEDSKDVHYLAGRVLYDLGLTEAAIYHYSIAIEKAPEFLNAYINSGNIYLNIASYDKALSWLFRAYAVSPDDFTVNYNLGNVLYKKGNFAESARYFKKASIINPVNGEVLYMLGMTYKRLSLPEAAMEYFSATVSITPG